MEWRLWFYFLLLQLVFYAHKVTDTRYPSLLVSIETKKIILIEQVCTYMNNISFHRKSLKQLVHLYRICFKWSSVCFISSIHILYRIRIRYFIYRRTPFRKFMRNNFAVQWLFKRSYKWSKIFRCGYVFSFYSTITLCLSVLSMNQLK